MAYSTVEDQEKVLLLRKWVIVNITYNFLDLGTSRLIKVRSEIIIAVLLKIQVF